MRRDWMDKKETLAWVDAFYGTVLQGKEEVLSAQDPDSLCNFTLLQPSRVADE